MLLCVGVCWCVLVCVGVIAVQVVLRELDWFCVQGRPECQLSPMCTGLRLDSQLDCSYTASWTTLAQLGGLRLYSQLDYAYTGL